MNSDLTLRTQSEGVVSSLLRQISRSKRWLLVLNLVFVSVSGFEITSAAVFSPNWNETASYLNEKAFVRVCILGNVLKHSMDRLFLLMVQVWNRQINMISIELQFQEEDYHLHYNVTISALWSVFLCVFQPADRCFGSQNWWHRRCSIPIKYKSANYARETWLIVARYRYRGVLIHSCFEIHNDRRLTQKQVTSVHKEFSGGPRQRHSDFILH